MSALEEQFAEIVRQVVREELERHRPIEPLMTAEQVADSLGCGVQKVYALRREGHLDAVALSAREFRFTVDAVREFQLRKGIRAA